MAPRLSWSAAALAGCVVVAIAAGTVDFPGIVSAREDRGARERYWEIRREVGAEELRLQVQAAFDSVAPLLARGPGLTLDTRVPLAADAVDSLRWAVQRELGDVTAPKARIGVFVVGSAPAAGEVVERAPATYQLRADTTPEPTCTVVATVPADRAEGWLWNPLRLGAWTDSGWVRTVAVLGGCRLWARYGAPGPRIADWMARRGYALAELDAPLLTSWSAMVRSRGTLRQRLVETTRRGYALPEYGSHALECRSGDGAACADALFADPADPSFPGRFGGFPEQVAPAQAVAGGYVRSPRRAQELGPAEAALIAALEREFGADRFARFWTSDQDAAAAFPDAFGVTAAVWLPGWLERQYGPLFRGPAVSLASTGISLLLIAALFGAALATARARQR